MKRPRVLRRFARRFGYARLVCLALLIGLAAFRIADPAPVEELRVKTFDTFQVIDLKTAKPLESAIRPKAEFPWRWVKRHAMPRSI
jgi:adenylate cyclase